MTAVVPGRAPATDAELIRSFHDRIRALELSRTVRVGPWVLGSDPLTGALMATRPGQAVLIDGSGATEIAAEAVNLSGYVTNDQLTAALAGFTPGGTDGVTDMIDSAFAELYEMLTGTGISPVDALTKLSQFFKIELGGPVDISRLPLLPLSHIRDIISELLDDPDFNNPDTLAGFTDWVWDGTDGVDTPGVAKLVADGLTHTIFSNNIPVAEGDTLDLMAKAKWESLTTSAPTPIQMLVSFYDEADAMIGAPILLASAGGPGTSGGVGGWVTMTGSQDVPAGASYAVQELNVTPGATGGVVKFGQASLSKSGLLPQGYVSGLLDALSGLWSGLAARAQDFADLLDVFGGFTVGSGDGQLTDVFNRVRWLDPASGLFDAAKLGNLAGLPTIPDGLTKVPDLQALYDAASNALSGNSLIGEELTGTGLDLVKPTMENVFATLAANTRKLQALETEAVAASTGGRKFNINFAEYPDGAFPSGLFNITMSGPGTSSLGISDGRAIWNLVNNGARRATMVYPTPLLTDFMVVRGTMASAPEQGTNVRIWALARVNAAATEYVWARGYCTGFLSYKGDIGCVAGGVTYTWASNVSLTWSLDMRLVCGVGTNARRHQVISGDTIVWDGIEPAGQQSVIANDHRYWGSITETDGQNTPGAIQGVSVVDNAPPAVVGTSFRASRRSGSDVTVGSGGVKLPNNFYETTDYISPDLTYTPGTNCRLTCTKQGTYLVQYRVLHGVYATGTGGHGLLYKNGAIHTRGHWGGNPFNASGWAQATTEDATTASFIVPLNPGDYIEPGFHFTNSMSNTGDAAKMADGSQSWFAVTRVGI